MELRRELLLTIGVLILINLVLAFGTIGLLVRMGPPIERILEENVVSIDAAEEILAELAQAGSSPLTPDARSRVWQALDDAKRNVTEDEERPVLAALERTLPSAMDGDAEERGRVVASARRLIGINREAMRDVDQEARRLGGAGAWAAVLIGILSFLFSVIVVVRLQRRFVRPLVDLHRVLIAAREGDRLRRCRLADAPTEVIQVTRAVNRLLDERLERTHDRVAAGNADHSDREPRGRRSG